MNRAQFPVVAHVLMLRDDGRSLFLLRRAHTGFMDGYFVLPGGHQDSGEMVMATAQRECEEETGVQHPQLNPCCVLPYRSGNHQGLNFVFETTQWGGEPQVAETELFDLGQWYPIGSLPEPCAPWIARVLQMREQGQWYAELVWD